MGKYFIKTPWWLKKVYPKRLWSVSTTEKNIYLTFDDGPHQIATPFVLDELRKHNAKATFFCIGKNVIKHKTRMYSQKDIFNIEDAMTWVSKKRTKVFYLEPKLDGCSCNLLYVNGKLKSIATRGDGLVGQDITYLKDSILNIPLKKV